MYTVTLNKAGHEEKRLIGSKAFNLANLTGQNIRIPTGFVITSDALDRFLKANGLQPDENLKDIEEWFLRATVPDEVQQEVSTAFSQLQEMDGHHAVAVRSSSSNEDLEEASFAGQYETILNVTDLPHLLKSIKSCWASLFSAQVREYSLQKNVEWNLDSPPMGVLVQRMVQADVSGVVFSMNPVTQDEEEIVINASYGLGEAIVSGLVTPDTFIVGKTDGYVKKELGLKDMKIVAADKETMEAETTKLEQTSFCLTDDQIDELAEQTRKIETFFGHPVDIEFAVKDGSIYILQARPVTT